MAALAALVASTMAAAAFAGDGGRAKVELTTKDQAIARAVLIRRADLKPAGGWTGGETKPNLAPLKCPNYRPKRSDLVVTGAVAVEWYRGGPDFRGFGSEATVLRTARMVRLDWQRSTQASGLLSCLRQRLPEKLGESASAVSLTRVQIPHIAPCAAAFRVLWTTLGQRVTLEDIAVCRGRTEIEVTAFGPAHAQSSVSAAALRLARILVSRARA